MNIRSEGSSADPAVQSVEAWHLGEVQSRLHDRTFRVGIVGLGYVGIPLALRIGEAGLPAMGFDVLPERVEQLNAGVSPIRHISDEQIAALVGHGFEATLDMSRASECDALLLCLPTPLDKHREPDLTFVLSTMDALAPHLRSGQILSLESTTWPGTTDEVLAERVRACGLTPGEDFFLVYSPEREDPGNADFAARRIPKIVGGHSPACREAGVALYSSFIDLVVPVSSTRTAEMVKLVENIYRSVNIGLVNELKMVSERMGLDIFEIIWAASTKPFGFQPFFPGPGVGGHCIPVDPFYLTWKAREYGLHTRFIELAGEINASMPDYVVSRLVEALNLRRKSLNGARVLALGIAYKPDVDDVRESPSVLVMERLQEWGANVHYHDPHVPRFPRMRDHRFDLSSIELTREALESFDAVVLLTDHHAVDYEMVLAHAPLVLDTRGTYRGRTADHLVRA